MNGSHPIAPPLHCNFFRKAGCTAPTTPCVGTIHWGTLPVRPRGWGCQKSPFISGALLLMTSGIIEIAISTTGDRSLWVESVYAATLENWEGEWCVKKERKQLPNIVSRLAEKISNISVNFSEIKVIFHTSSCTVSRSEGKQTKKNILIRAAWERNPLKD